MEQERLENNGIRAIKDLNSGYERNGLKQGVTKAVRRFNRLFLRADEKM